MAEEDDILEGLDDAAALEEAMDLDGGGEGASEEELDPLAEEMLRMMEDEGGEGEEAASGDVDQMLEMEMLKAMEEDGGGAAVASAAAAGAGASLPGNIDRLMEVALTVTIELGRTRETI